MTERTKQKKSTYHPECPKCLGQMLPRRYNPEPGIDRTMRLFVCTCCSYNEFRVIMEDKLRAIVDEEITESESVPKETAVHD